ncbi:hypothetical protein GW750_07700 [bacterium]|nr:hypothetical protein [bacterium]
MFFVTVRANNNTLERAHGVTAKSTNTLISFAIATCCILQATGATLVIYQAKELREIEHE